MEGLSRVSKRPEGMDDCKMRLGRPRRETFALRSYNAGSTMILTVLPHLVTEVDKIDFYVSDSGFAVMISPKGERSISKSHNNRNAGVPLAVRTKLKLPEGTTDITVVEDRGDGLYFFPFSQFDKA